MSQENYSLIQGFKCYAPDMAVSNEDFPVEGFDALFNNEEKNFWFRSRNQVILTLFKKYSGKSPVNFLEIGCGTGYVLKAISAEGHSVTGAEIHVEGLRFARKRLADAELIQLDATRIPFRDQYQAIGAFDVLEHIEQDTLVMDEVKKALIPGGFFYISVPQYPWMWSYLDDVAFHKRRYTRKELKSKLQNAGYEVKYISSFVFTLFPAMMLSRMFKKEEAPAQENREKIDSEFNIPDWLNFIFRNLLRVDEFFIRMGISLPFGGSLVAVARKPIQKNA